MPQVNAGRIRNGFASNSSALAWVRGTRSRPAGRQAPSLEIVSWLPETPGLPPARIYRVWRLAMRPGPAQGIGFLYNLQSKRRRKEKPSTRTAFLAQCDRRDLPPRSYIAES